MKRRPGTVSHDEALARELKASPEAALHYLDVSFEHAMEDDEPRLFLLALGQVVKAIGVARVAASVRVKRESLHRMLSARGNPEWRSLFRVFRALGVRPRFV